VILVEGIFLFKQTYRSQFDLAIWVDCSFPTALARALERSQEGLPPAETIAAYETIYFPAQQIHFNKDNPRAAADLIYDNNPYAIEHCFLASSLKRNALGWQPSLTEHRARSFFQRF
jgi:uridine kinase